MDQAELRELQAPLKDRYRAEPEAAVITLKATGQLNEEKISCSIATGRALAEAGLHPATGGDGMLACSGDMLLEALGACAGVTMCSVATALGLQVEGHIRAEGDLDFRGTLGIAKDEGVAVGFRDIRLVFDVETDGDEAQRAKLMELTERYCVVLQTLTGGVSVTNSMSSS